MSQDIRQGLADGLDQFSQWIDTVGDMGDVAWAIPLAGGPSLGSLTHFGDVIDQYFVQKITAALRAAANPLSLDDLTALLDGLAGSFTAVFDGVQMPLDIAVDPAGVLGNLTATEINFTLPLEAVLPSLGSLDLGSVLAQYQMDLPSDIDLDVLASLSMDMTFGLSLVDGLPSPNGFFVRPGDFDLGAAFGSLDPQVADIDVPVGLGFLDANIVDGFVQMLANMELDFHNPDLDPLGNFTLDELRLTPLEELLSSLPTGNLSGLLPVQAMLGSANFGAPQISLDCPDIFTQPVNVSFNADMGNLLPFGRIDADMVMAAFDQLGTALSGLKTADVFTQVAALGTQKLSDLMALGEALRDMVQSALIQPVPDAYQVYETAFASAQELLQHLTDASGVVLSSAANFADGVLTYTIHFADSSIASEPFAYDYAAGPLSFSAQGKVTCDLATEVTLTLGLDLSAMSAQVTGTQTPPINGQLSQSVSFDVQVGQDAPVHVVVPQDATEDNAGLADLVADINDALAAAGLKTPGLAGVALVQALVVTVTPPEGGDPQQRIALRTAAPWMPSRLKLTPGSGAGQFGFSAAQEDHAEPEDFAFIENASASAGALLSATMPAGGQGLGGQGHLGLLGSIELWDATASLAGVGSTVENPVRASVSFHLGQANTRYGLADLAAAVRDNSEQLVGDSLTFDAQATCQFRVVLKSDIIELLDLDPNRQWFASITFPDVTSGQLPTVTGLEELLGLACQITPGDFVGALKAVVSYLTDLGTLSGPLNWQVPGTSLQLGSLLDYAGQFSDFVRQFEIQGPSALDIGLPAVAAEIRGLLGLAGDEFTLDIDPGSPGVPAALKMRFAFESAFDRQEALSLDLAKLMGGDLWPEMADYTQIADLGAAGSVHATGSASAVLDVGIDLQNAQPFLYDDTRIAGTLAVEVRDLAFDLTLGPLTGMSVAGGHLLVGDCPATGPAAFGEGAIAPASFALALTDEDPPTLGRFYLADLASSGYSAVKPTMDAQVDLLLPFNGLWVDDAQNDLWMLAGVSGQGELTNFDGGFPAFVTPNVLNIEVLKDGLRILLSRLRDALGEQAFSLDLPIVGTQLNTAYLDALIGRLNSWTLYEPARALGWAVDNLSAMFGLSAQIASAQTSDPEASNAAMEFRVQLGDTYTFAAGAIDFSTGLPGLGLDVQAKASADLHWAFNLGFGVRKDRGFYLITSDEGFATPLRFADNSATLGVTLSAAVTNLDADGTLGFLTIKADKIEGKPIGATGFFNITLGAFANGRVYFNTLGASTYAVDVAYGISADINATLEVCYSENFPSILTDLNVHWAFDNDPATPVVPIEASLDDIRIDLGEYLGTVAEPVLGTIDKMLAPIRPILEVLTMPLPGISDLAGYDVTLLSLIESFADGDPDTRYIADLARIVQIAADMPTFSSYFIHLGTYTFGQGLAVAELPEDVVLQSDLFQIDGSPSGEAHSAGGDFGAFLSDLDSLGFRLPILDDPFRVVQLFLGQDVELVEYATPELSLQVDYRKSWPIIVPWLQFTVSMEACISAKAVFGYDTRGLREFADGGSAGDLLDGFYVRAGSNYPLLKFDGHAAVGVGLGIGGGAGIEGGIGLTGHVYAADTDGDGRLHLDEFADYLPNNVFDAFDADGSIYVDLRLWWDTMFFSGHYTLAEATLMDFSTGSAGAPQNIEINFNERATQNATNLGMAPNAHVMPNPWASRGVQWYKFQTDRDNEILDFQAVDWGRNNDLVVAVFDGDGNRLANSPLGHGSAGLNDIAFAKAGTYYVALTEPADDLPPESLTITPNSNPADGTVVYYVNDQDDTSPNDPLYPYYEANPFTSAVGNDANSGLDPAHPKASIAAVTSSLTGHEGRVYILVDSGHYHITGFDQTAVVEQDNVWLVGTHYSDVSFATYKAVYAANAGNLHVYGLNFDGDGQTTAIDAWATGIPQAGASGLAAEYAATIEQNEFRNCGIGIYAEGYQSVVISGNRFSGAGTSGIDLGIAAIAMVNGNNFAGYHGAYAIRSAGRFSAYVAGNVLTGSQAAVEMLDGASVTLKGNTITGDVIVRGDRDNTIDGNTITGNLSVRSPEDPDWRSVPWPGQWIDPAYLDPMRSYPEFSQGIVGNTISGVVRIQHPVSTVIEGNISLGGVVVEGDNDLLTPVAIRENIAINAGAGTAIEVTNHSWADITDNATIAGAVGVRIDSGQMSLISGNVIVGSQYGIHVGNAGSVTALENGIRDGVVGVLVESSGYVNIQDNQISGSAYSIHGIGNWVAPRVVSNALDGPVNFEGGEEVVPAPFRQQGRFLQNIVKGDVVLHTGHRLDVADNVLSTGSLTVWTSDRGRVTANDVSGHLTITTGANATASGNILHFGNLGLTVASGHDWQVMANILEAQAGGVTVTGGRRGDVLGNSVANGGLQISITDEPTNDLAATTITGNSITGELQLTGGPGADICENILLGNLNVHIAGAWEQPDRAFHTEVKDNLSITGMSGRDLLVSVAGELNFSNNLIGICHLRLGSVGATWLQDNTLVDGHVFITVIGSAEDWGDDPTVISGNTIQAGKVWVTGGPGVDVYENVHIHNGVEVTTSTDWLPQGRQWHSTVRDNADIGGIILDLPGSACVSGNTITNWGGIEISGTSLAPHSVLNNTVNSDDIEVSSRSTANIVGNTVGAGSITVTVVDGALPRTSHVVSDNQVSGSIDINGGPCATIDNNTLIGGSIYVKIADNQIIAGQDNTTYIRGNWVQAGGIDARLAAGGVVAPAAGEAAAPDQPNRVNFIRLYGSSATPHQVYGNLVGGNIEVSAGPGVVITDNGDLDTSHKLQTIQVRLTAPAGQASTITGNTANRIDLQLTAGAQIDHNTVGSGGMIVSGSSPVAHVIEDNTIAGGGLALTAGPYAHIVGNHILAGGVTVTIAAGQLIAGQPNVSLLQDNDIGGGVVLNLSAPGQVLDNRLTAGGLEITGTAGAGGHLVQDNVIEGTLRISAGGAIAHEVTANAISGGAKGVEIVGAVFVHVHNNVGIQGSDYGVYVQGNADVLVEDEPQIEGGLWGLAVSGNAHLAAEGDHIVGGLSTNSSVAGAIAGNDITHAGGTGLAIAGSAAHVVHGNAIHGCLLGADYTSAALAFYGNEVFGNTTGVATTATVGPADWAEPNDIHDNTLGVQAYAGAVVRFNRIGGNATGIDADSSASIHHNLLLGNTVAGVRVQGASNVSVVSNTIVSSSGDGVHVSASSGSFTLRDNILWSAGGYDLYVANDSQVGLASDYNNLYASGPGKLVWYEKPFDDLLDWQIESLYDAHSIGYTRIDAGRDDPRFVDAAGGDYRLLGTSTSIDAGDPADAYALEPAPSGGRINLGAYGNTPQATASPAAAWLRLEYPSFHANWQVDRARMIRWSNWNVTGLVSVDVYDGLGNLAGHVGNYDASAGSCLWSPQAAGLPADLAGQYRVRVTSLAQPAVLAESREAFTVVPAGGTFYINDAATADDEYTSAAGDNRKSGLSSNAPMASLLALLRMYDLGGGDVIYVDDGAYVLVDNLLIGGAGSAGDDAGVRIVGPVQAGASAVMDRAVTRAGTVALDVDAAAGVAVENISFLGGQKGLWLHNGSPRFRGVALSFAGNASDGVRIEADSLTPYLERATIVGAGGMGIYCAAPDLTVLDSTISGNAGTGISMPAAGAADIRGNAIFGNAAGIAITHSVAGTTAVVGALGRGNLVRDNAASGIVASGGVKVEGNTVSGHHAAGAVGVSITRAFTGEPQANYNAVFGNADGIVANTNGTVTGNLVYDNLHVGIKACQQEGVSGNVLHGNDVGIDLWSYYSGTVEHNLVYASATAGIRVTGNSTGAITLRHNTIDQPTGDAVRLQAGADDVTLLNNIVRVGGGYGLYVTNDSQDGFAGDYNLIQVIGSGKTGYWQGAQGMLSQWRLASGQDSNSLWADPLFVNSAAGDYHLQSTQGSRHGGTLAVVLDGQGLPTAHSGVLTVDAGYSPAIDRASPGSAYSLEPSPNGGFANLGAFGNSSQASLSKEQYVTVLAPRTGDTWLTGRQATVSWRSQDFTGAVDIDLLQGGTFLRALAGGAANTGSLALTVPADLPAGGDYAVRVTRGLAGGTSETFSVQAFLGIYYVNDSQFSAGDWTTAAGSSANTGLSDDSPKSSIAEIFAGYVLSAGDTIRVDAGAYTLSSNLLLLAAESGIHIVGYHDAAHADRHAVLNRANTLAGSYVFELAGASNFSLEYLSITGASVGVYAADSTAAAGVSLCGNTLYGNDLWGAWLGSGVMAPSIVDNEFSGLASGGVAQDGGVYSSGASAVVMGNRIHDHAERYKAGVDIRGADAIAQGNTLTANYNGITVSGARSFVRGNDISGGQTGVSAAGITTRADWIEVSGNIVHGEAFQGIYAGTGVLITGNTVYGVNHGQGGGTQAGAIFATGDIIGNVVHDSTWGIRSGGYTGMVVRGNLLYGNVIGIYSTSGLIERNVVHDNGTGIWTSGYYASQVLNNVAYGNTTAGVVIHGATSSGDVVTVSNNTLCASTGSALLLENGANHVTLANNIVFVSGGYGVYVSADSQAAFASDYNLFCTTGAGKAGYWQADRATLADWATASGKDANSLSADPMFVDASGGDFHVKSPYGSYHGGSLAVGLDGVSGLPVAVSGVWTNDAVGTPSPAIDRGDAASAYANEPTPNGGFVNIGAFGNTGQASKSPASFVMVLAPQTGVTWMTNRQATIRWRSQDLAGTVDVELMQNGAVVRTIATGTANTGSLAWSVPRDLAQASNYAVRVTRGGGVVGLSGTFSIVPAAAVYYVNDAGVSQGDWTTVAGNDVADGLTPQTPRASIASILSGYQLASGDIVYVDAGAYTLAGNLVLAAAQSGIRIVGYHDAAHADRFALLNRNNTASTSYAVQFTGADNVSLEYLRIAGAYYGVYAAASAGSTGVTIQDCWFYGNANYGVYIGTGNADASILRSTFHGQLFAGVRQPKGIRIESELAEVRDSHLYDLYGGGYYEAMYLSGADAVIAGNMLENNNSDTGIWHSGLRGSVSGNTVSGGSSGIYVSSGSNNRVDWTTVSGNVVHGQTFQGISVGASVFTGNTVYSVRGGGSNAGAIFVAWYADVIDNVAYDSTDGIHSGIYSGLVIRGNRIFACDTGILTYSGLIEGNRVYSNGIGIQSGGYYSSQLFNNLLYANTTAGLVMDNVGSGSSQVRNNTIYQPLGDGIRLQNAATNVLLRNNVVVVGSGYAIRMSDDSQAGFDSDYDLFYTTGTGKVGLWQGQSFATVEDWFYKVGMDFHGAQGDPLFIDPNGVDNILGYTGGVDGGLDDNFSLAAASPAVGKGDPFVPTPAQALGGVSRATLGHQGGTPAAQVGDPQGVSLITLNGLEKVSQGDTVKVQWQSWGLSSYRALVQSNSGGVKNGYWSDVCRTGGYLYTNASPVSTSGVSNPAPADVYATYADNYSSDLSYYIPTPDGTFTLRLHFAEPTYSSAGSRKFDIVVQGQTVQSNFDIAATAGGKNIAVVREFQVTASGGAGIRLSFTNRTGSAIISGLEVLAVEPLGSASPTVNLECSTDGGQNWSPVASNLTMDRLGRGEYLWNVQSPVSSSAKLRLVSQVPGVADTSDRPFQIAAAGSNYYVNDSAVQAGDWTSAVGGDANSGKSPDAPMASLSTLLSLYSPGAGAHIYVDAGTYALGRNLRLDGRFTGLTIVGYQDPAHADRSAVLARGTTASGSYGIELAGADNVTLRGLALTGAYAGIYAADSAGSLSLTVDSCRLYGNSSAGVWIGSGNSSPHIVNSDFDGRSSLGVAQYKGLYVNSPSAVVSSNRVHDHSGSNGTGVELNSSCDADVFGNAIYNNWYGIYGPSGTAVRSTVHDNDIYGSIGYGICAYGWALIQGNTVRDSVTGSYRWGIYAASNTVETVANMVYNVRIGVYATGTARDNTVYSCTTGIQTYSTSTIIEANTVYNSTTGIDMQGGGTVRRNTIYSNGTGLTNTGTNGGRIENNLIYANDERGMVLTGANSASYPIEVASNTIYQPVGDAVRLDPDARNIHLFNNIFQVDNGYCLYVAAGTTTNYAADYNLFYCPFASGNVGRWSATTAQGLAAWQAASGQDAHSLAGDAKFVDPNGADDVLGYAAPPGGSEMNGGADDNFNLAAGSAAIDRGYSWKLPVTDRTGQGRVDDPGTPNAGGGDYVVTDLGHSEFAGVGTAQNWKADDNYWTLTFSGGFTFPFYGTTYTSCRVTSNGFLYFGTDSTATYDSSNTTAELAARPMIAPMWMNLKTNGAGDDIYVDASVAGQVTVRWNATVVVMGNDANFAVVLYADGRIRFDYGLGNANLASPTVGISAGTDGQYLLLPYDGRSNLTAAASLQVGLAPGFVDIGAYEFRGSTLDTTPPAVTATSPSAVLSAGQTGLRITQVGLTFSEPVNDVDALAIGNYELRKAVGGVFGPGDVLISLIPQYQVGATTVQLLLPQGALAEGLYRLTVRGSAGAALHDLAGLRLDGDGDGQAGGDFQRDFTVLGAGVIVSPTSPLTVDEQGSSAQFTVRLQRQPSGPVTLAVTSSDTTEGTVSTGSLTFTLANWDQPQAVTVHGVDDPARDGDQPFTVTVGPPQTQDPLYQSLAAQAVNVTNLDDERASVAGRRIFYNHSAWDGNDPAANAADDAAIAFSKLALLPGGAACLANFTSYSRGINGIMVDITGLADPAGLTVQNIGNYFTFLAGNDTNPDAWAAAAAPTEVHVRPGAGDGGSDRVTIIWADNAIQKTWLQVAVLANAHTGLTDGDVFYFGNLPGDVTGDGTVGVGDYLTVKCQYGMTVQTAGEMADFDCSGDVGRGDLAAVGPNFGQSLNMTFSPPVPVAAPVENTSSDEGPAQPDPVEDQSPAAEEPPVSPAPVDEPQEVVPQDTGGAVATDPLPLAEAVPAATTEPAPLPLAEAEIPAIAGESSVLADALGSVQAEPQPPSVPLPTSIATDPAAEPAESETGLTSQATVDAPACVPAAPASLSLGSLALPAASSLPADPCAVGHGSFVPASSVDLLAGFDVLGSSRPGVERADSASRRPGGSMMVALALPAGQAGVGRLPQHRGLPGWLDWKPAAGAAAAGSDGTASPQSQALDALAVPGLRCLPARGAAGVLRRLWP